MTKPFTIRARLIETGEIIAEATDFDELQRLVRDKLLAIGLGPDTEWELSAPAHDAEDWGIAE
jgi:hypothetical protein